MCAWSQMAPGSDSSPIAGLVTTFCEASSAKALQACVPQLKRLLLDLKAGGKENSGQAAGKAVWGAVLQCFKSAQARLGETQADAAAVAQLTAIARCSLAALESAAGSSGSAASLQSLRYNLVRRLVSLKDFAAALEEATPLYEQLAGQRGGGAPASPEAANLSVGLALTLLVCWVEGRQAAAPHVDRALHAAAALPAWLGCVRAP